MIQPAKVLHDTCKPFPLGDGLSLTCHFGLAFELDRFSNSKQVLPSKDGVIPGFCSWYVYFPGKQLAIAASSNNFDANIPLLLFIRKLAEKM